MRFCQIDRITELEPGQKLQAVRGLALNEAYLQDHFPKFPVMPGVLMLESMYQAAMWLVLVSENFQYSTVVMRNVNNVKFNDFVEPGKQLVVSVDWKSRDGEQIQVVTSGMIDGKRAVRARLTLDRYNMADRNQTPPNVDRLLIRMRRKELFRLLDPRSETSRQILESGDLN